LNTKKKNPARLYAKVVPRRNAQAPLAKNSRNQNRRTLRRGGLVN
jgi:hypothetical protein